MMTSPSPTGATGRSTTIETRYSWTVATAALVALALSFGGPWIATVSLTTLASDFGSGRSVPSLAVSLAWFGTAVGGVIMGPLAARYGIRLTTILGAVMIAAGLGISTLGGPWALWIGHGLFIGIFGNGGINAPLYVYVSRWFDRRRGSALALISSGTYVAGALWPPVFARVTALYDWRVTMLGYAFVTIATIIPIAAVFFREPPEPAATEGLTSHPLHKRKVFGWDHRAVFGLLWIAPILCCIPMAMPQGHLVAFCGDLGISPAHGAAMLSTVLGSAFVARQLWGLLSDRFGGVLTVLIGSLCQIIAMVAFSLTQDEFGLFAISALYGLGFSGIIPAYALAVRELFPSGDAAWRLPLVLFSAQTGMALGSWGAGVLYDHFGYYGPAFEVGIAFNLLNLLVVGLLVVRQRGYGKVAVAV